MISFNSFYNLIYVRLSESKLTDSLEINNLKMLPVAAPYGFWMDRHGNLEIVRPQEHEKVAQDLLIKKPESGKATDTLLSYGWIRIVRDLNRKFYFDHYNTHKPTPAQEKTIKYIKEIYPEIHN